MEYMRQVDVIIPVYNAYDSLIKCVDSVFAHTDFSCARVVFVEDKSTFYDIACEGRREAFWNFMQPLGMSKVTVINRFKKWNFYEWELRGVEAIVEQICRVDC